MKYSDYYEKKQHGSTDFPMQYYHLTDRHLDYTMVPHWHKEFELLKIISGSFKLFLNNVEYTLGAGDIALISCGILHRGEPQDCEYECIVFDLNMLRRSQKDIISSFMTPIMNGNMMATGILNHNNGMLYSTAASLFAALKEGSQYYELSVYGLLFKLFALLYESGNIIPAQRRKRTGHQTDIMLTLLDWIESHYTEVITLHTLSQLSGMNEKYLCRLFKEFTNRTPIDYINNLRIESACHEITVNNRNITEVAFECGFNDLSYFSRAFKKYKGITPNSYKKMYFTEA